MLATADTSHRWEQLLRCMDQVDAKLHELPGHKRARYLHARREILSALSSAIGYQEAELGVIPPPVTVSMAIAWLGSLLTKAVAAVTWRRVALAGLAATVYATHREIAKGAKQVTEQASDALSVGVWLAMGVGVVALADYLIPTRRARRRRIAEDVLPYDHEPPDRDPWYSRGRLWGRERRAPPSSSSVRLWSEEEDYYS